MLSHDNVSILKVVIRYCHMTTSFISSIIYVLISQITWTCKIFAKTYSPIYFGKERGVSYLPLSHIVAQVHLGEGGVGWGWVKQELFFFY